MNTSTWLGLRKLDEGVGGTERPLRVEVDQHLIDDYRESLSALPKLSDKAESQR